MPELEDQVKHILLNLQSVQTKKLNDKISGMIVIGFMIGVVFAYTGLLGFCSGFVMGAVVMRNFDKSASLPMYLSSLFQNAVMSLIYENDN